MTVDATAAVAKRIGRGPLPAPVAAGCVWKMTQNVPAKVEGDPRRLIEVLAVLNNLTVSLRRIGEYQLAYGEQAAKDALSAYLGPNMTQQIAHARRLLVEVLEEQDPTIREYLEELGDRLSPYWSGPA